MAVFTLTKASGANINVGYQNYQVNAKNGGVDPTDSTTYVAPMDTGTILGTTPPGQPGLKLVDGTQQYATMAKAAVIIQSGYGYDGNFTQDPAYQGQPAGYSILGE